MTNDRKKERKKLRYLREKIIEPRRRLGKSKHFGIGDSLGGGGSQALKCAYIILKWWKKRETKREKGEIRCCSKQCRGIIHIQLRLQHTNGKICFRHHMFSYLTCAPFVNCGVRTLHILSSFRLWAIGFCLLFLSVCIRILVQYYDMTFCKWY